MMVLYTLMLYFFFKQKTAYEMRISDWSADVCSSGLIAMIKWWGAKVLYEVIDRAIQVHGSLGYTTDLPLESMYRHARAARIYDGPSSEERRVGKDCVSTCRSRWSPSH